jgi:hypothetical protein
MPNVYTLEGRLRHAGDGYEWHAHYIDDIRLDEFFDDNLKNVPVQKKYVVIPEPSWDTPHHSDYPPTWTSWEDALDAYEGVPHAGRIYRDFGRVRITIEVLEDEED